MSYLSYSTNYQGIVEVFMRDPNRYLPFTQLLTEVMNGKSELSIPQREMIAFYVSTLNECHYCVDAHRAVLTAMGVDDTKISAVKSGAFSDERIGPILVFAAKLTNTPGVISQADVDAVRAAGWSDQSVEDVISVVSLFSYLNRLVDGFGIDGSAEGFAQAGAMISQHGYGPVVQMVQGKAVA